MLTINTTFFMEESVAAQFLKWLKTEYAPMFEFTKCPKCFRVLAEQEPGVRSFAFQFTMEDDNYQEEWESVGFQNLRKELTEKFGTKVMPFSTCLRQI